MDALDGKIRTIPRQYVKHSIRTDTALYLGIAKVELIQKNVYYFPPRDTTLQTKGADHIWITIFLSGRRPSRGE